MTQQKYYKLTHNQDGKIIDCRTPVEGYTVECTQFGEDKDKYDVCFYKKAKVRTLNVLDENFIGSFYFKRLVRNPKEIDEFDRLVKETIKDYLVGKGLKGFDSIKYVIKGDPFEFAFKPDSFFLS